MTDRPARRPRCHTDRIADAESLGLLKSAGQAWLLALLADPGVYRADGRLHMVRAARAAGMSPWRLRRQLGLAREVIAGGTA